MPNTPPAPDEETARSLATAVARSAELVAELEDRTTRLDTANGELAAANARSAELVAELQSQREELEWANANLRQEGEARKRLLGVVAHDLRGGLGSVLALAEQVRDTHAGDAAKRLPREIARLLKLLETLLGGSQEDADHLVLRAQSLAMERVLADIVEAHRHTAERKDQHLHLTCAPAEIRLDADPIRLRQALDNLLSNAIKFTPHGGRIDVMAIETRGDVEISVSDDGPGLTADDLDRVFGEFSRLSATPTGGEASHGLGLAIVQRIAVAHGGSAHAANRGKRGGACFRIHLPAPVTPGDRRRVLLVDDDRGNRRLLGSQLERLGLYFEECEDGAEAISRVLSAAPGYYDLVLMDVEMPGMTGLEATERIRQGGIDTARLPIVAVTGHADAEHVHEALRRGMNDIVTKPLRNPAVRCLLRRWGRRSPQPTTGR